MKGCGSDATRASRRTRRHGRPERSSPHTRTRRRPRGGVFSGRARQRTSAATISTARFTLPFVAAYMRSSLNASAVDYQFLASQGVAASEVRTKLVTPSQLLAEHLPSVRTIDYVNVDVESQELAILRVWPFERVCVDVFNIENQPPNGEPSILRPLQELLEPHGYRHLVRIGVDEVFRRQPPCEPAEPPREPVDRLLEQRLHLVHLRANLARPQAGRPRRADEIRRSKPASK